MSKQQASLFTRFAKWTSSVTGKPATFIIAVLTIIIWAVSGPVFGFSDTWQLVINTGTTIITFLMVFLIQNTQNRDSTAVQLKLDELICAIREANDEFLDVEELDDRELADKHKQMIARAEKAKNNINEIDETSEDKSVKAES